MIPAPSPPNVFLRPEITREEVREAREVREVREAREARETGGTRRDPVSPMYGPPSINPSYSTCGSATLIDLAVSPTGVRPYGRCNHVGGPFKKHISAS
jgi:hypothetical protein